MSEWQPIKTMPASEFSETKEQVLVWFPCWTVAAVAEIRKHKFANGLDVFQLVDQWDNEPFLKGDDSEAEATLWQRIPRPDQ